jgi:hypothetical protein
VDTIDGIVDAILLDTGELQTDWHDGGRLDLLLDAAGGAGTPPTVVQIRQEMDANSTQLAAIVADTNELQLGLVDGGRLDLLIDAIKAKTDIIPAAPASTTNITAGTITTVTNLTNAPTNGDLTATMKGSVTTAATAATPTVTAGTVSDKTGYALTAAYDAAKTAATQASVNDLPTNAELATALAGADDVTLAAIAALNNLSSAQAQTAATAALNAYDPPTNAEMVARTLPSDDYVVVSDLPAAPPSAADIKTALEADGSKLDHLWEMTADDGGVRQLTANALELAPTGGSAPTVQQIRAEIDSNSTQLAAIVLDTGELQTDWHDGGRLDLLLDAAGGGSGLTAQETANAVHNLAPVGAAAAGSLGAKVDAKAEPGDPMTIARRP